ncbi:hypothetical protein MKX03_008580 [Papaver bracteatum]|nr:hypothetical protein MKX03_008580 [Papaver bracteatum]
MNDQPKVKLIFQNPLTMLHSATNSIITAKYHTFVQLYTCHIDESGIYTGQLRTFALSGFLRAQDTIHQKKSVKNIFP